jgi:hypothetical protein
VGLIVYFRKEGRALGEVTKCTSPSLTPLTHIPTLPYLSLLVLLPPASHYLLPLYSLQVENPSPTAPTAPTAPTPPARASVYSCSRSARTALTIDLVYNSRKRGGDSADRYFKATEMIAGVKDMRFQSIMPDTLHWLGVQKIDNMISMVCSHFNLPHLSMLYSDTDEIE